MKKIILLTSTLFAINGYAQNYAAGIVLGAPTGLSGKMKINDINFLSLGLSGNYSYLNYNWKSKEGIGVENTTVYYGPGVVTKKSFGARGTLGLEYDIPKSQFHGFGEASVDLYFSDDFDTSAVAAIGARYTF